MRVRRPPRIKPSSSKPARPWRVAALALIVLATGAWCWPRPDNRQAAGSNGRVLVQLIDRYASDHHGAACEDLPTLLSAEASGYGLRLRNPYSGAIGGLNDPAIARPLKRYRDRPAEAGLVFYQAVPDALGRVCWLVSVADSRGTLRRIAGH